MRVNIALLEDEATERAHTERLLEKFFSEIGISYEISYFADADSFLSNSNGFKDFQLLLMDIILPESDVNGIDLACEVRKVNRDVAIMFITKTVQFAINGYEVDAVDYVVKPLEYEDFALKLKKAMRYILLHTEKFIVLNTKSGTEKIGESRIYYIEVMLHYLIVHTQKGDFTVRGSMQKLKDKVQSLAQELEGATEQINGLKSEVAELKVANAELAESDTKLAIKNKIRNARKRKK